MIRLALTFMMMATTSVQPARVHPYAQKLVDGIVADNPALLDALMHVSPTPSAQNVVIAAHLRHAIGEASGADDLGVAATAAPLVEIQKDGRRLGVLVQLRDANRRPIGALGLMFRYRPGDDVEADIRRSFAIRDAIARRITSIGQLAGGYE